LSAATQDDSLSDDGSVPMFQNSDDNGSDSGSDDDCDCSVDEGIATEVVGERVADTDIGEESLSQVKAAVTSHSAKRKRTITHVSLAIKEFLIPRKIVKSISPSLTIAEELPIPGKKGATPKSTPAPNCEGEQKYRQEGERHRHRPGACRPEEERRRQEWRCQGLGWCRQELPCQEDQWCCREQEERRCPELCCCQGEVTCRRRVILLSEKTNT
jgi:hypothetical protein